jgi:hypothetical protein
MTVSVNLWKWNRVFRRWECHKRDQLYDLPPGAARQSAEAAFSIAGVKPSDLTPSGAPALAPASAARGGPFRPMAAPGSVDAISRMLDELDVAVALNTDVFTLIESRLLESRLQALPHRLLCQRQPQAEQGCSPLRPDKPQPMRCMQ